MIVPGGAQTWGAMRDSNVFCKNEVVESVDAVPAVEKPCCSSLTCSAV
jgi:hypothetical protein